MEIDDNRQQPAAEKKKEASAEATSTPKEEKKASKSKPKASRMSRRTRIFFNKIWGEVAAFESVPGMPSKIQINKMFVGELTETFKFQNNKGLIIMLFILAFFYVSNRFACERQMREVDVLQKQLKDIKYEVLTRSTRLMDISKQSKVAQKAEQEHLQLEESTVPPFRLDK